MERTTCCIVGGGPAGMMLGLLLARGGVEVTVLEKHGDFLRDFRGDTVHPSTLQLLDELGLGERFAALPQRRVEQLTVELDGGAIPAVDFGRLPGRHRHIAFVPQWDFLDLLATAGASEPAFDLRLGAEAVGVLRDDHERRSPGGSTVGGVRYRETTRGTSQDSASQQDSTSQGRDGERELLADLVVACDGRGSTVREAAGLRPRAFGVPMDVWWFRLPRHQSDPEGPAGRFSTGRIAILIDRGDYWQCGYVIGKGHDAALRAGDLGPLRAGMRALVPWLGERVEALGSWDDVRLLDVRLDRLRRWWAPGLLCLGDAAHAMSPVGGVGINLAVQDAVAAARLLAEPLRAHRLGPRDLRRVQRRRWWPTAATQAAQRTIHARLLGPALAGRPPGRASTGLPLPMRLLARHPVLRGLPARAVGLGLRPEHAPTFAVATDVERY